MKKEEGLIKKWKVFLNIILSPGSILPLIAAGISLFLAIFILKSPVSDLLSIFSSILATIAGFFIKDDWDKWQGNSMLEKKGKSALRNLDAISQQVMQIRRWIRSFISKKEASKRELEEIDRHLDTMEMQLKSGLADWIDIVPELKQKEEEYRNYNDTIKAYIEERLKSQKKLLTVGADKVLKEQLENRIGELEEKVKSLRKEQYGALASSNISVGTPSLSSLNKGVSLSNLNKKKCENCGKEYNDNFLNWASPSISGSLTFSRDLCEECRPNHGN